MRIRVLLAAGAAQPVVHADTDQRGAQYPVYRVADGWLFPRHPGGFGGEMNRAAVALEQFPGEHHHDRRHEDTRAGGKRAHDEEERRDVVLARRAEADAEVVVDGVDFVAVVGLEKDIADEDPPEDQPYHKLRVSDYRGRRCRRGAMAAIRITSGDQAMSRARKHWLGWRAGFKIAVAMPSEPYGTGQGRWNSTLGF